LGQIQQLEGALRQIGVANGDTVFVHSDLRKFGMVRTAGTIELALSPADLFAALRTIIGDSGTIVVPTFTPDWMPDAVFDPQSTPGKMGGFSELIRQQPGAQRSNHPIVSVAALGLSSAMLLEKVDDSGFGADTPFARMLTLNARMLMVGVPLCSFKDHVEWRVGVPYRYQKLFTTYNGECFQHNVRFRVDSRSLGMTTFLEGLTTKENAAIRSVSYAQGKLHALDATTMLTVLTSALAADPFRFVTDDLGFRREMTFLRDLMRNGAIADIRQTPGGETWTWKLDRKSDPVHVGGQIPGSEICLYAARKVLSNTGSGKIGPAEARRLFGAQLIGAQTQQAVL
jgi:aminoglycoside 3-N-acetyltransferase